MRYEKNNFCLVPNIEQLKGLDVHVQVLWLWLCKHTDREGLCYPSIKRLSECSSLSNKTIIKYLKVLEEKGFIKKFKIDTPDKKFKRNQYEILIKSVKDTHGNENQHVTEVHTNYKYNNNSNNNNKLLLPKDSNTHEEDEEKKKRLNLEINAILKVWNDYNPILGYNKSVQRNSVQALIEKIGFDKAMEATKFVISIQGKPYAPDVVSPYQMRLKQAKLNNYIEREKNK